MHSFGTTSPGPLQRFNPPVPVLFAASLIFAFAVWIRLHGVAWDQYASLHPDERHLLFVMSDMLERWKAPAAVRLSLWDLWFQTGTSPLDPRAKGGIYVYGEWPLLTMTLIVKFTALEGWENFLRVGRSLTAVVEATTCLAVFMASFRLTSAALASLAACLLYAAAPTALQLANFYTVDGWLMAATGWSLATVIFFVRSPSVARAVAVGIFCGLAVACKVTGIALAAPVLLSLLVVWRRIGIARTGLLGLAILLAGLVVFRLFNPFVFSGPGFWGVLPSDGFWHSLSAMASLVSAQDYPPNWQWIAGYSAWAFWRDFLLFGSGPVLALAGLCGVVAAMRHHNRPCLPIVAIALLSAAVFLNLPLLSDIRALRYAAPAIAPLAIVASMGLRQLPRAIVLAIAVAALWWGSGMVILHGTTNSRVEASQWLWNGAAKGSVLVNETSWDDGLPVKVAKPDGSGFKYPTDSGYFELLTLQITDNDNGTKADQMADILGRADYVIQSSGRQRDVMPRLPQRFPMTTAFYDALAKGALCFSPAWDKGDVYPLPFLPFRDGFSQETWRVYDHPRVIIYRPEACRNSGSIRTMLRNALPAQ